VGDSVVIVDTYPVVSGFCTFLMSISVLTVVVARTGVEVRVEIGVDNIKEVGV